jgi:hypothetical protein
MNGITIATKMMAELLTTLENMGWDTLGLMVGSEEIYLTLKLLEPNQLKKGGVKTLKNNTDRQPVPGPAA